MANWAIFGTGFISRTVAEAIQNRPGSTLLAVAGRSKENVDSFAAAYDIPRRYASYDDALQDVDIDVVYIGLPNHVHLNMVQSASAAGKAVLSEKSLTTTFEDAVALLECVKTSNTFFVEGLMYLSHPLYQFVPDLLSDARIGRIRSITAIYAANIHAVVNPNGGGTLYNLGCYPVSLLHFVIQTMFGDAAFSNRVLTASGNVNTDGNICDTAATVRFGNGVLATLHSTDSYGMHHSFEVVGDRGALKFITNPWLPNAGDNVLEIQEFKKPAERLVFADNKDAFHHQIAMVENCLERGVTQADRPSPRWSDSLEIMRFLTDWEEAARA